MTNQGLYCLSSFGNTGVSRCGIDLEQLEGFILCDKSKTYTMSGYATEALFLAALQADALQTVKLNRIYPYLVARGATNATSENTVKDDNGGYSMDVYHENPSWKIKLDERGFRQLASLDTWRHNKDAAIIPVFKGAKGNSVLMFVKNAAGLMTPAECFIYGDMLGIAEKTKADKTVTVKFKDNELFFGAANSIEMWQLSAGTKLSRNLHGVHDVKLNVVSASTTVIQVEAIDAHSGEILGDSFSTAMIQAGYFLVNIASTGASVSQTPSWNAITKRFSLTGTFTTVLHYVSTAAPSVAAALSPVPFGNGITGGYEMIEAQSCTPA